LGKFFPLNLLSLSNIIIARLDSEQDPEHREPLVSVIIPARNEAGNIHEVLSRTPNMGRGTELVFIEGHSKDNTYEVIQQAIEKYPNRRIQLHRQSGEGKGDAVRLGFEKAKGEMLIILDADLSVPPEDLPRFYNVLITGKGEFVNGVRLVYPMEEKAMRFFNLLGNKFFSYVFSWMLEQPIKDTLCGTKALFKEDYNNIAKGRKYFGDFDPFGDYDLLFGAARNNLKIVEIPIRYRQRKYGETNIQRWKHGWLLLKMAVIAAKKIKFT
jgi:glycosyltransferase involved in cell wall biosynthesis